MKGLWVTLALDTKIQAKNKLYTIGIFVAFLLGFALRFMSAEDSVGRGLVAFYLLGLGGTTFMFAASMLLFDRSEGTLNALRVSRLTASEYVISKVLTLGVFSGIESAIVYLIAARGIPTNFLYLLLGLIVLGSFYTMLGIGLVAPFHSVTKFLLPTGTLVAMLLQLPVLSLAGIGSETLWWWIPSQAPLLLMKAAFEPLSPQEWIYASLMSVCMLIAAYFFSLYRCSRYAGLAWGER